MKIESGKFKFLRNLKDKTQNPNAIRLLEEIESLFDKGVDGKAKMLLKRYKKRYAAPSSFHVIAKFICRK